MANSKNTAPNGENPRNSQQNVRLAMSFTNAMKKALSTPLPKKLVKKDKDSKN
ncbi:hypothetical protein [Ferruginibacter sp. HRS2-29]|uniref:hypothetical protein n=1 Tax=Ferruginibacter sp. HRS2-29 TaxID=2487334 RepID=UPI0020CF7DDB|nr:hypothetical protein [Ferruginibacter sp. HRS2-29]